KVIDAMGNKSNAIALMKKGSVPVVPGSEGSLSCFDECKSVAKEIGYPVMIKAAHGGGGRGIRIVWDPKDLEKEYHNARSEAQAAFGNGEVYLEKYVVEPRHIEIQILADEKGNVVHLGERDCSIQRRNQKVIEEAPSPSLCKNLRKKMGEAAVNAAKAVNYSNAGTVEFLVDKFDNFYFIEMNTRIQVEHGVTELVTGIDIVKEQLKIASGKPLSFKQKDIDIEGHAIECRINAEDPENDFRPSPGKIEKLFLPGGPGVRVDSGVYEGYTISPFYDSMVGKLMTYGKDREEAICRMRRALGEFIIQGVDNNVDFQLRLLNEKEFIDGKYHTGFINSL
ncbi:MAG: ATP-grasp domain-containing protein, partial [Clostridium sp.]